MTQKTLAVLSGVPQQTISSVESGKRTNPGVETLYPICRVLGCTLNEIYVPTETEGGEEDVRGIQDEGEG